MSRRQVTLAIVHEGSLRHSAQKKFHLYPRHLNDVMIFKRLRLWADGHAVYPRNALIIDGLYLNDIVALSTAGYGRH